MLLESIMKPQPDKVFIALETLIVNVGATYLNDFITKLELIISFICVYVSPVFMLMHQLSVSDKHLES